MADGSGGTFLDEERDRVLAARLQIDEIRQQELEQERERADEALAARASALEHERNARDASLADAPLPAEHEQEERLRASLAWHATVDSFLSILLVVLASASREAPPKTLAATALLLHAAAIMAVRPNALVHLALAHPVLAGIAAAFRCALPAMTENFLVGSSSAVLAVPALHHFGLAAQRATLCWRRSIKAPSRSRSSSRSSGSNRPRRPVRSRRSASGDDGGIALSSVT
jgi:hypothetical protein